MVHLLKQFNLILNQKKCEIETKRFPEDILRMLVKSERFMRKKLTACVITKLLVLLRDCSCAVLAMIPMVKKNIIASLIQKTGNKQKQQQEQYNYLPKIRYIPANSNTNRGWSLFKYIITLYTCHNFYNIYKETKVKYYSVDF